MNIKRQHSRPAVLTREAYTSKLLYRVNNLFEKYSVFLQKRIAGANKRDLKFQLASLLITKLMAPLPPKCNIASISKANSS